MKCSGTKDCDRPLYCRGMCRLHYDRRMRAGLIPKVQPREKRDPTCTVGDCKKPHRAHGMCTMHLQRLVRNGQTELVEEDTTCGLPGCTTSTRPYGGNGFCKRHYQNQVRYGDPLGGEIPRGRFHLDHDREREMTRLIRADLLNARTMHELGRRRDVHTLLDQAERHGRPLTRLERECADGLRMKPDRERDQAVLAADIEQLTRKGLGAEEIGSLLGVSSRTVVRKRAELGLAQSTWNNRKE